MSGSKTSAARFSDHNKITPPCTTTTTTTLTLPSSTSFSTTTHPHYCTHHQQHEQQQEDNNNNDGASDSMSSISDDASHTHHSHQHSKAKPSPASEPSLRRKQQERELEAKDDKMLHANDVRVVKLENQVEELRRKCEQASKAEREMRQLYESKDFARQDTIVASLESNIRALKTQNETAYQKIRQLLPLEGECARLLAVNEEMGQELIESRQDLERYLDELEEVAGESAALQDEVALLQKDLIQAKGVSAMLRRQVTELTARAEEDQQEMERLKEEADTNTFHLHNAEEDFYSKCEIWQRECARLESKLENVVQEKDAVEAARAMQEKEKEAQEEQLVRACDEMALLKVSNATLWSRLEATHAELSKETAQKEAAQQENDALAVELRSMQAASQDREEETSGLHAVNSRLRKQLEAMKEERQQHAREIASLRRTIAPLSVRPHQRLSSSSSSSSSPSSSGGGMVDVRTPLKELHRAAGTLASPPPSSCAGRPHALLNAPPALASLPSSLHPGPPARVLGDKDKALQKLHQPQKEKEEALDSKEKENMGDSNRQQQKQQV